MFRLQLILLDMMKKKILKRSKYINEFWEPTKFNIIHEKHELTRKRIKLIINLGINRKMLNIENIKKEIVEALKPLNLEKIIE